MNNKGLTLVETIIYTALIGVVATGFISYSLVVINLKNKNYVIEEVNNSSRNVISVISGKIKQAGSIILPISGATSSVLILEARDSSTSSIETVNNIVRYSASNAAVNISGSNIKITNLIFENLSAASEKDNIRITFTAAYMEPESREYRHEENLQMAAAVR